MIQQKFYKFQKKIQKDGNIKVSQGKKEQGEKQAIQKWKNI